MSFYNYGQPHQQQATTTGTPGYGQPAQNLQFIHGQYDTPAFASGGISGSMTPQTGASTYSYGNEREGLSKGLLAAFGTSGYPGEPPLLEGM